MTTAEQFGIAGFLISMLLGLIFGLIVVIYRNDREAYKADKAAADIRIAALEKQNVEQETRIATLVANSAHAERHDARLEDALERLDSTQNAILQELAQQRGVLQELSRRLTGSPMPAVRPSRPGGG